MSQDISKVIEEHFKSLKDPRRKTANQRHKLIDILIRAICAIICGANGWVSVEKFGKEETAKVGIKNKRLIAGMILILKKC